MFRSIGVIINDEMGQSLAMISLVTATQPKACRSINVGVGLLVWWVAWWNRGVRVLTDHYHSNRDGDVAGRETLRRGLHRHPFVTCARIEVE